MGQRVFLDSLQGFYFEFGHVVSDLDRTGTLGLCRINVKQARQVEVSEEVVLRLGLEPVTNISDQGVVFSLESGRLSDVVRRCGVLARF